MSTLTHFDNHGMAHMVDVADKASTNRTAIATGHIEMLPATRALIESGSAKKGDVLGIARVAAIMAAKKPANSFPCATLWRSPMWESSSPSLRVKAQALTAFAAPPP